MITRRTTKKQPLKRDKKKTKKSREPEIDTVYSDKDGIDMKVIMYSKEKKMVAYRTSVYQEVCSLNKFKNLLAPYEFE